MFRWALTDLRWCATTYWLFLWARSDLAAHLVMRYTAKKPLLRVSWPPRRGAPHEFRDKFLDTEWLALEQQEPGNTTTHTFHLDLAGLPRQLWAIFTAPPPHPQPASQSPLIHLLFPVEPEYTLLDYEPWTG